MSEKTDVKKVEKSNTDSAQLIYVLYLAGVFTFGFSSALGLVWVYLEQGSAGEMLASHYTFLVNSFWKGLVFFLIGGVITPFIVLAGFLVWAFLAVWIFARMIKGLKAVRAGVAIEDPKRWGF